MHFGTKSYLKSIRNHTVKNALNTKTQQLGALIKQLYYLIKEFRYD